MALTYPVHEKHVEGIPRNSWAIAPYFLKNLKLICTRYIAMSEYIRIHGNKALTI